MFGNRIWQMVTVTGAAVILFFSITVAVSKGRADAEAETIVRNTAELERALDFFYNDQDRFPTAIEFSNSAVFGRYAEGFPPKEFASQACPQTFVYKQLRSDSYQLNFCLPADAAGFQKGWNQKVVEK